MKEFGTLLVGIEIKMKKILVLTALRSGSTYLVDNLILSIEKKYSISPTSQDLALFNKKNPEPDNTVNNDFSITKLYWLYYLQEISKVDSLFNYDAILLKRKDKLAQSISMLTAVQNPQIAFNFYKGEVQEWKKWIQSDPKHYITKESFHLYFWTREHLEKGVEEYKEKFKSFTEVYYEDFDNNVENLKKILESVELPYHDNYEHRDISEKRNWDIWNSIINKQEVLKWAENLFLEHGYEIDLKYYKEK